MNRIALFLGAMLIVAAACTNKTKPTVDNSAASATTYRTLLKNYDKILPNYKSMASDIRLDASLDGSSYRASGLIRHVRDEGLFVSVKKLGFEIGQVLITPDSFFVLNRWDKEYVKEPISIIEEQYKIKGEFAMVEELLTGLPVISSYKKNAKSTIENGHHRLETPSAYDDIDLVVWISGDTQPVRQAYYQDGKSRGIRMKYNNETKNEVVIERELHTENIEEEVHVKLEYRNPSFNDAKLPTFRIPSHYTRTRL